MDKKKIFYIVIAIIIALGILITCVLGFNVNIVYSEHKQVDIYIGKEFESKDIENIAKEVLGKQEIFVEKVELYEDMVSINAKEITNEQLEQLNQKINEKYESENSIDSLKIITVPKVKLLDKITPYIMPSVIAIGVIIIYAIIRYRKLGILKVLLKMFKINIIAQGLYFSILSITRLPINRLTIPVALVLAIITLFITFYKLENSKYKKEIETTKNNKK